MSDWYGIPSGDPFADELFKCSNGAEFLVQPLLCVVGVPQAAEMILKPVPVVSLSLNQALE